jgi:hypothetical protein
MGFERFHQVQWRSHANASNRLRKNSTVSCFPIGKVWPYEIGAEVSAARHAYLGANFVLSVSMLYCMVMARLVG